jgi:hypothetical protein
MSAIDSWFLLERGRIVGPYTYAQLEDMRSQGICNSSTQVSVDQRQWQRIDDLLRGSPAGAVDGFDGRSRPVAPTIAEASLGGGGAIGRGGIFLRPMPVLPLLLLHFLTGGIFTFFWTTTRHGQLPAVRPDDPSASKAISFCFIPFYNLYWVFVVYPRLAVRMNSLASQYQLPTAVPLPLAYALCGLLVVPAAMATAGSIVLMFLMFSEDPISEAVMVFFGLPNVLTLINFLFVAPVYAALLQSGINQIFELQVANCG